MALTDSFDATLLPAAATPALVREPSPAGPPVPINAEAPAQPPVAVEAVVPGEERPLFHLALRLAGERCLVVGGGPVGARKAASLLECGALVTVVAPVVCAALEALPVSIERRRYRAGEAAGYGVVVTATGLPDVDKAVYLDCRRAGVLVNAVDDPSSCSFLAPAVLRQGQVSVAVSTAGASPWLAGWVRRRIGTVIGPDVGLLTEIVGAARSSVRASGRSSEGLDWAGLVDGVLWPLVSAGQTDRARAAALEWVAGLIGSGDASAVGAAHADDAGPAGRDRSAGSG